jgi:hypothetical protein
MRIMLMQAITPEIKDYSAYSLPINLQYCIEKGYHYMLYSGEEEDLKGQHPAWLKMSCLEKLNLERYDWIWVLDCDAVVNNFSITLESIIEKDPKPIIISENDLNGGRLLNSGSTIYRSDFIPKLLARYDRCIEEGYRFLSERFWDQELINDMYLEDPSLFSVRPMQELNSYWKVDLFTDYEISQIGVGNSSPVDQTDNFVHHYMSIPAPIRVRQLKERASKHFKK